MKILIFGLISGQGGIQTHLYWLSKILLESNSKILIITPNLFDRDPENSFQENAVSPSTLQIITVTSSNHYNQVFPSFLTKHFYSYRDLFKTINRFSPDLFIGIGTGWLMSLISLVLPAKTRKIFHEVMSGKANPGSDPRWAVRSTFTDVIAQAEDVALNFSESFGWRKKIPVLPAFSQPLEITALLPPVQQKSVPLATAKAAFFSRLVPHKKAFWLVQQWHILKENLGELHIHGTGPEETLIRNYIQTKGIGNRVKCWGKYPEAQEYVNLLSHYDLTLLPTLGAEGSPLVLLESMACGVPFVAYGVGGIADYGKNNPDAIVVPPEPWLTTQARNYTLTTPAGENQAFLNAIKIMTKQLAIGLIDQSRLQQFYLKNYSYEVLKKRWLDYLFA